MPKLSKTWATTMDQVKCSNFYNSQKKAVRNNKAITKPEKPAPHANSEQLDGIANSIPSVNTIQSLGYTDRRMTSNMTMDTQLVPRVSYTTVPKVEKKTKMDVKN